MLLVQSSRKVPLWLPPSPHKGETDGAPCPGQGGVLHTPPLKIYSEMPRKSLSHTDGQHRRDDGRRRQHGRLAPVALGQHIEHGELRGDDGDELHLEHVVPEGERQRQDEFEDRDAAVTR